MRAINQSKEMEGRGRTAGAAAAAPKQWGKERREGTKQVKGVCYTRAPLILRNRVREPHYNCSQETGGLKLFTGINKVKK